MTQTILAPRAGESLRCRKVPCSLRSRLDFLAEPGNYAGAVAGIKVVETHLSWVFLADGDAYKLKKPLRFDHNDLRTVTARRTRRTVVARESGRKCGLPASRRKTMTTKRWAMAVLALCALGARAGASPESVETIPGSDRFVAGGSVVFAEPVAGDLIAAGGDVESGAVVQGDALLAGGNLRLGGRVGQNAYAAGGKVLVNAAIARNVRVAGGQAEIGPKAVVEGNVTIAGGQVTIRGAVKGYVQAAGGRVFIDGPIDGDVVTASGEIELGPAARIGGKLHYRSHEELRRDPAAEVAGGIEHIGSSTGGAPPNTYSNYTTWKTGWVWTAGLMILAALIAGALPAYSQRAGEPLRVHPWLALFFGFIAIVCVPVAVIMLLITIVGIPLALLVLLLYFALLIVGYVTTALALGDTALARYRSQDVARAGWRVGAAVAAVLVLALLGRVPFIGGLVVFVAMIAGIGSVIMSLRPRTAR